MGCLPSRPRGLLVTLLGFVLAGVFWMPAAWAHEGEEPIAARDAVLQALAYIVNTPENMDVVADKVAEALEAEETAGVDLDLVERAQSALERQDMTEARDLLQRAIGAPPDGSTVTLGVGMDTGTSVVTDPMPGRADLTGADVGLLVVAGLLGVAGVLLSIRLRPPDTIRALRRRAELAGRR